jgi:hypothetical protein
MERTLPNERSTMRRALSAALPFAVAVALCAVTRSVGPSAEAGTSFAFEPLPSASPTEVEPTLLPFRATEEDSALGGAICVTDDGAGYESDAC